MYFVKQRFTVKFNLLSVIFWGCFFGFVSSFGDVLEVPAQATDESLLYIRKRQNDAMTYLVCSD